MNKKEDKPKKISAIRLFGRGDRQSHTYEIYGKQGSIELQLTERIAFKSDADFLGLCAQTSREKSLKANILN